MRDKRAKRDVHGLDAEGMLFCNPRDREAAHRAEDSGIATTVFDDVTCSKCRKLIYRDRREAKARDRSGGG